MSTPFSSRYDGLSDRQHIIRCATVRPLALLGLETCDMHAAAERLRNQLKRIYIPNEFALSFISEMVESSAWYCAEKYADEPSYFRSIYHPSDAEVMPICLTGLAGVGKSVLLDALLRVLPEPIPFRPEASSDEIRLVSCWRATARDKSTAKQLLAELVQSGGSEKDCHGTASHLLKVARSYAGKVGLPLILLDELQHVTLSTTATALTTSQLLTMAKIGVPMVYVSNYSLQNKLFKRNAEEKHRLTSNPRIMLPDEPDSSDWAAYVEECVRVAGPYLAVDAENLSSYLYANTFGLKRFVVELFRLAYIETRQRGQQRIELTDFVSAHASAAYTGKRDEVSILGRQETERHVRQPDLWCPYELPRKKLSKVVDFYRDEADKRLSQTALEKSLTPLERKTFQRLAGANDSTVKVKVPRNQARRKNPTHDDLLTGHHRYSDKDEET